MIKDASGQRFTYDAESHQKEFFAAGNGTSNPDAAYLYDGDGRRVKKITNAETSIFVYNASGQLVAEYSTAVAPAETAQVSYLTTDHLGSPRVVTDKNGTVIDRKDYSAFGEESTSAERSSNTEYTAADQLRKSYTGYEKDGESGLEFAQARYYNPTHGRFTSVDPLTASGSIRDPQTFNRYSYVLNSPFKFTDPLGLIPWRGSGFDASDFRGVFGGGPAAYGCSAEFSSCSGSGWGGAASPMLPENDPVVVNVNIVYNSKQMTEAGARDSMKDAITDLQSTYGAINVQFSITFTAGTADLTSTELEGCPNCAYQITSGAVEGAVNVFLHDNTKYLTGSVSAFVPESRQIFIQKSSGVSLKGKLTHEIGHLFRYFVNGDPRGGIPLPAFTGAGWTLVSSGVHSEDSVINSAHDKMRLGGLRYKIDYVDDYRSVTTTVVTPSFTAKHLGELAPRRTVTRSPTPFDVYRLGARLVGAQGR